MIKQDRKYIKTVRYIFQWGMFVFILVGGWNFYRFVEHFRIGSPDVSRPPLVEGFLPIGGLMTLKRFFLTGELDPVHPAAAVILLSAIVVSFLLSKSFCGWVCPVGTVSEAAFLVGQKLFGKNFRVQKHIDYALRSLKYILLGFFGYVILIKMSVRAIEGFTSTPYWSVSDVKMLLFFTNMSTTTIAVLAVLTVLSLVYKNFWCRYLCPYGALTGLFGVISPIKITRNESACINCHKCTTHCPNLIDVESTGRVNSPECTGCMTCVANCPSKGALDMALPNRKVLSPKLFMVLVVAVFFAAIWTAMLTGHWKSNVTSEQYMRLIPITHKLDHP
jgi:polyferredoxin